MAPPETEIQHADVSEARAYRDRVSTDSEPWPSPPYAWYVVGILMLAYTNSFIDRQILSLLIEPIRRDLEISDTQVSLLAGFAFSIFYTTLGVPIARLADQKNRKVIIAAGVAAWSVATALCGITRSFWQLFAARVGVGVGEATLSPAAFSIIADYFPRHKLGRATSVYSMGVYFGAGLALIIGGAVIKMVSEAGAVTLPLVGSVRPWQLTFFAVGLLGLPIFLLILTIREPVRRGLAARNAGSPEHPSSLAALTGFMRANLQTVVLHFAAFSLVGTAIVGYMIWTPTFFIRSYGWEASTIGWVYGTVLFVFGTAGVYAGGFVADWLEKRGRTDAILRAALYGGLVVLPFAVLTPLMPNALLAVASLAGATFFFAFPQGLPAAALQVITPNALRAQMTAVYFLVGNLIALGFGPTFFALVTDFGFGDPAKLRYSLSVGSAVMIPLGLLCMFLSLKPYRQSVARTQQAIATE
jgi:MFS family permease